MVYDTPEEKEIVRLEAKLLKITTQRDELLKACQSALGYLIQTGAPRGFTFDLVEKAVNQAK